MRKRSNSPMSKLVLPALVACSFLACAGASFAAPSSVLWGKSGECWSNGSRLPDFSQAGYRRGAVPIPDVPAQANVRDFGAKGDGTTDDTQAFLAAIASMTNGALLIPAGRYPIRKPLIIQRGNVVL